MTASAAMRSRPHPLAIAFFAVFAAFIVLIGVVALTGNASDGDPVVNLALSPMPAQSPSGPAQNETGAAGQPAAGLPGAVRAVNGNLVADPAFLEDTPEGVLPARAADGRKPMDVYARPFNRADTRPRVAVVIGGLGISAIATKLALDHLPPGVTLSFAPYASDVQSWVDMARGQGHEVLLEVPMEPFDFPESDPGPHTLLAAAGSEENMRRLSWALSRFTGYVGVTNLLGWRFLGETPALEPVLATLTLRGLLFFDNGAYTRSIATEAARRLRTPNATGAVVLDAVQSKDTIDAKLNELETRARESGFASASGFLYPVTIERVANWAATLESRGLVLAPITAVVSRPDAGTPAPPAP